MDSTKRIFNWGIIGPGKIAHKFAQAMANCSNASLYAVASRDVAKANAFAAEYSIPHVFDSYETMVKNPTIDIVYIATPHAFHKENTLLCLRNNKPVLCEKPLAHKFSDVQEMIAMAKEKNLFLMEAMWTRFLPPINKAIELIEKGEIGKLQSIQADFGFATEFNAESRLYDIRLGGGSLLDIGVYPLMLILTIAGKPESVRAEAVLASTGVDIDFKGVLHYPKLFGALYSSISGNSPKEAIIKGEKGSIEFKSPWYRETSILVKRTGQQDEEFSFPETGNGFEYQIQEAMRCLSAGVIESPLLPHEFSLLQSETLDSLCKAAGIVYP